MDRKTKKEVLKFCKTLTVLYVSNDLDSEVSDYFEEIFDRLIHCTNTKEALEKFNTNKIFLLITDIELPKIDAFSLIKETKKINPELISIIYTQNDEKINFMNAITCGVNGYLLKPLDKVEFLNILSKFVEIEKIKEDKKILKKQYDAMVDESTIVSKTDRHGIITYVNDNFCKTSEYSREELIGKSHNIVRHPDNPKELFKDLWNTIRVKKEPWHGVFKNLSKSGKPYFIKTMIKPMFDSNGDVVEYVSIRSNLNTVMSDKKQLLLHR